ncbi:MAG: ABC transporter ATP-binding protein [Desulfurococcales archaeon]|nr:ABC transporter ATP-binding protein [Desulfurococcales archaeon]MEB3789461.1 ABC transporter ATP-binding protein [Desulfurococcales archaeon]
MGYRISLDNVSYKYPGQNRYSVSEISIKFNPGIVYGLIGSNGAGKTTLLKIIALIYKPNKGKLLYNNSDPWNNVVFYRRSIAYVHEKPIMIRASVYNNLAYPLKIRGISKEEINKRIDRVSRLFGIQDLLGKNAKTLSTGEKQIIGIARALIYDPEVIVLDEPFSNLDYHKRRILLDVIDSQASQGKTIILASHDTLMIEKISSKILVLENGKALCFGPTRQIIEKLYEYSCNS